MYKDVTVNARIELKLKKGTITAMHDADKRKTHQTSSVDKLFEELLAGITEENRHDAIDFGPAIGKEIF